MAEEQAKERKSLGVVFPNTNKENPKSYDLKGTVTVERSLHLTRSSHISFPCTVGCTPDNARDQRD